MHFGKKILHCREAATATKWIKSGKNVGEDKIRHKMLKALTKEEILG